MGKTKNLIFNSLINYPLGGFTASLPQREWDFQMDWYEQLYLKFIPLCATFLVKSTADDVEIFYIKVWSGYATFN